MIIERSRICRSVSLLVLGTSLRVRLILRRRIGPARRAWASIVRIVSSSVRRLRVLLLLLLMHRRRRQRSRRRLIAVTTLLALPLPAISFNWIVRHRRRRRTRIVRIVRPCIRRKCFHARIVAHSRNAKSLHRQLVQELCSVRLLLLLGLHERRSTGIEGLRTLPPWIVRATLSRIVVLLGK